MRSISTHLIAVATTLDELLDLSDCKPPIGIKIDTEGYELCLRCV